MPALGQISHKENVVKSAVKRLIETRGLQGTFELLKAIEGRTKLAGLAFGEFMNALPLDR